MSQSIQAEAETFAKSYVTLFSSPACSSSEDVAHIANEVGKRYRPGITFFTNGQITRFESQEQSAHLIEQEMRSNIASGMGTHLELLSIEKVEVYSSTSALCWLYWVFHPKPGSEFAGKDWKFTNIYGYRAASEDVAAGWEFVVRDQEINAFKEATGGSFLS
ncbi:hypothetical protein LTR91_018987 [Friedmanniomyces endolithicus]|uniref:Uncharacterized protein n=1 Tax=Friedmanniomyces endolithicus TaxID=329885 RepID=A0AAN6HC02_9PEZI|nr:hypothetical protein LTR94_022474 [Friedmanniomyces endolithicus]KAK0768521.1 hypothetical protein LTR59_017603 [Friedmanniomyces endolithicus]KAK0770212.1 hypothetical protein LTR38_017645 [Friedmanniomyces endolithicus]KAK0776904.1 hypothetical protein LTR75_016112 [Friedmanniomyces endolithicus]KAK0835294.1 hypothetical protein LTR03_014074 [Friedmanniomyces endolithicus]